jgi:Ppx/GppA phosphatase family
MKPPKVYIAAPFRSDSDRTGTTLSTAYGRMNDPRKVDLLQRIEDAFLDNGWTTCLPHRDEGNWGATYYEPRDIAALCLRHVETSSLICAIPGRSRGVHVELGWAGALRIPIVAFSLVDEEISTLQPGIGKSAKNSDSLPGRGELLHIEVENYDQIPTIVRDLSGSSSRLTKSAEKRLGIIDIGSNSVKLSIFSIREGRRPIPLSPPDRESISIADSVRSFGAISVEKLKEIRTTIERFERTISAEGAIPIVVGTEALRRATNLADVEEIVLELLGSQLQLLSQEDEAKAVANAVRASLTAEVPTACLNLGASSVQVTTSVDGDSPEAYLLKFGTKDITAAIPWNRPMARKEWNAVCVLAKKKIEANALESTKATEFLFHTGGELDFLLRCGVAMDVCDISTNHVSKISITDFREFAELFASRDPAHVEMTTGLKGAWLAGSVASNAIAISVAESLGAVNIVPSNLNVGDGLLK